ncbi:MAG: 50S ribosomal protein L20 [Candidatus Lloydbacteria bacterium CG22_combo_CG10-13_8_21_14_all_47_15]|uniref:Large ribosomal subunit protein bL20 n=1 Tax=Candidatus Lloydbacteria bacterium CG22_combo_CG10-13_8_21_14_all_47_15 TaxID=1974635 RepID=A0A2H0CX36_9BACT|nr:MAG: 50S ribosomal protein L20 [Candidatus Lloydbacteria bacterium CG22_combo_CG10-13_8_21_14_all_47_15]
MPRVKKGTGAAKRRRNILKSTKGYRFGRSTKKRQAREAILHAGHHAFADRRAKKRSFRGLWNININAAIRAHGLSYSRFINLLKQKNISVNRKMLAEIATESPDTFARIVKAATK